MDQHDESMSMKSTEIFNVAFTLPVCSRGSQQPRFRPPWSKRDRHEAMQDNGIGKTYQAVTTVEAMTDFFDILKIEKCNGS